MGNDQQLIERQKRLPNAVLMTLFVEGIVFRGILELSFNYHNTALDALGIAVATIANALYQAQKSPWLKRGVVAITLACQIGGMGIFLYTSTLSELTFTPIGAGPVLSVHFMPVPLFSSH